MKSIRKFTGFCCIIFGPFILGALYEYKQYPTRNLYRDVEGNEIPTRAVDSLVRAHFVLMTKNGADTISKYFHVKFKVE